MKLPYIFIGINYISIYRYWVLGIFTNALLMFLRCLLIFLPIFTNVLPMFYQCFTNVLPVFYHGASLVGVQAPASGREAIAGRPRACFMARTPTRLAPCTKGQPIRIDHNCTTS